MRKRPVLTAGLLVAVAGGSFAPALAGSKPKPVSKDYTATAATPGGAGSYADSSTCSNKVAGSTFDVTFRAPYAGRLSAKQDKFQGDWDLAFYQDGAVAAESAQQVTDPIDRPEEITDFKMKKGVEVTIRSCNFSGGSTAHVKYTFAPA